MPRYCCVSGCYTKGGSGIPLYTFKKDWLALAKWKNSSPKTICGLHFEKNIDCEKRNNLTKQCKPTIFPSSHIRLDHNYCLPPPEELLKRKEASDKKFEQITKKLYNTTGTKRKLEEKVKSLESLLSECEQKFSIPEDTMQVLQKAASKVPKTLFERTVKKLKYDQRPFYSPEIKRFSLTLHLHSASAYR